VPLSASAYLKKAYPAGSRLRSPPTPAI
jgi:hypothetical protein